MVVAAGIGSVVEIAVVAVAVTAAGEAVVVAFALEFVAEGNIVVVRVRELTSFAAAVVAAAVVAEIIVVVEPSSTFGSLLDKLRRDSDVGLEVEGKAPEEYFAHIGCAVAADYEVLFHAVVEVLGVNGRLVRFLVNPGLSGLVLYHRIAWISEPLIEIPFPA